MRPESLDALRKEVRAAAKARRRFAIAGGRHAMGGQQFATGELLIDMSGLNHPIALDKERGPP